MIARLLARLFTSFFPSFRPSVTPTRALSMCLRVFPRKAISLSLPLKPPQTSRLRLEMSAAAVSCAPLSLPWPPSISIPAVDTIHLRLCKSNRRRRDNNRVRWRSSQAGDQHFLVAGSSRRRSDLIRRTQRYRRRSDARRGRGRGERTPLGGCPTTTSGNNTSSPREQRSRKEAAPSV